MLQSDKDTEEEHELVTLPNVSISSSAPSKQSPIPTKSKDEFPSLPTNAPIEIVMTETKKGVTTSPVLAPSPAAFPSIPTNEVKLLLPTNAPIEIKNQENDTNSIIQESDKSAHIHDADDSSMIDGNKQTTQIEETHETIADGSKSGASIAVMPVVVGVAIATVGVGTGIFVKRHLQRKG
ncbi:predicted protein [Chaetoceros tenuissimus]|uniref:Uncharacterized protein n=1 Tax=Chaetoceros tenuissimus TaxID=426638 RepID=A0AAD3CPA3_9STRA|nr:predicted protein [Chaetoceros tenuissimus]